VSEDRLGRYAAALERIAARGCRLGSRRTCLAEYAEVAADVTAHNTAYAGAVLRGVHLCDACRAKQALEY
jgi:hypothetical protein